MTFRGGSSFWRRGVVCRSGLLVTARERSNRAGEGVGGGLAPLPQFRKNSKIGVFYMKI